MDKEQYRRLNETYSQTCDRYSQKKVRLRTEEQHQFLIKWKYYGSVRKYLLSMGEFKVNSPSSNNQNEGDKSE